VTLPRFSVVIHGHYYQPPRENPWLEEVEIEPTAAPFHDWNQRIEHESYRAVVAARLPGKDGRIAEIVNTLAWTSFNFGPTLLGWMESAAPDTYAAMLEADRESLKRWGHGNAIAQPYHHVILPLSTRRDKTTEVRWGIRDFRRRFGRDPEGMWLPETAVDDATLDVLAAEGIQFTILAPHQASPLPPKGLPGLYRTAGGRSIALFFYDGDLAHGVAFGELIRDAGLWTGRLRERGGQQQGGLVSIATDGETYGHHHKFGEMALARVLGDFRPGSTSTGAGPGGEVENFASFLARHPARHEVTLNEPSSWSCAHGVERWRSECGCRIETQRPTQQKWRAVLRDSLDWLAGEIHTMYEREAGPLFDDVWEARNRYDPDAPVSPDANPRARELLELERHALLLYTSCAWFFDDLARIEPIQVLQYAARAIELTGDQAARIEAEFVRRLAPAKSNDPLEGSGREVYLKRAKPAVPPEVRLAAGLALLASLKVDVADARARAFESLVAAAGERAWEITLKHIRTGRQHRYRVALVGPEIEVSLAESSLGSPLTWRLVEGVLWDRHRTLLGAARRSRLIQEVLSPDQREALAAGARDLDGTARDALTRRIGELVSGSDSEVTRIRHAVDLLSALDLQIPFDAQTLFARKLGQLSPEVQRRLQPLASRLGFDVGG
jgi:Domain of unknown function (DUF3536)/Glycosyl hydrolase family 57